MKKFYLVKVLMILISLFFFTSNFNLYAAKKSKLKSTTKTSQLSLQDYYKKATEEAVGKKKEDIKKIKPDIEEQELEKKVELSLTEKASSMATALKQWIRSKTTKTDIGMTEEQKKEELEKQRKEAEKISQELLDNFNKKNSGLISKLKKAGISEKRLSDLQTKKIATDLDIINLKKEMIKSDLKEMNSLLKMVDGDEKIDEERLGKKGYTIKNVDDLDVVASNIKEKINNIKSAMKILDDAAKKFEEEQSKLRLDIETKKIEGSKTKIEDDYWKKLKKSETNVIDKIKEKLQPVKEKIKETLTLKKETITDEDEPVVKRTAEEKLVDLEEEQTNLRALIEKNNTEVDKADKESEGLMKMIDSFRNGIYERELKIEDAEDQRNKEKIDALTEEIAVLKTQEEAASKMFNKSEKKKVQLKKEVEESKKRLNQIDKEIEQAKKDIVPEGLERSAESSKKAIDMKEKTIAKLREKKNKASSGEVHNLYLQIRKEEDALAQKRNLFQEDMIALRILQKGKADLSDEQKTKLENEKAAKTYLIRNNEDELAKYNNEILKLDLSKEKDIKRFEEILNKQSILVGKIANFESELGLIDVELKGYPQGYDARINQNRILIDTKNRSAKELENRIKVMEKIITNIDKVIEKVPNTKQGVLEKDVLSLDKKQYGTLLKKYREELEYKKEFEEELEDMKKLKEMEDRELGKGKETEIKLNEDSAKKQKEEELYQKSMKELDELLGGLNKPVDDKAVGA